MLYLITLKSSIIGTKIHFASISCKFSCKKQLVLKVTSGLPVFRQAVREK